MMQPLYWLLSYDDPPPEQACNPLDCTICLWRVRIWESSHREASFSKVGASVRGLGQGSGHARVRLYKDTLLCTHPTCVLPPRLR